MGFYMNSFSKSIFIFSIIIMLVFSPFVTNAQFDDRDDDGPITDIGGNTTNDDPETESTPPETENATSTDPEGVYDDLEGMELCVEAGKLATRFGAFTTLDYVEENTMNKVRGYLKDEFLNVTGINLDLDIDIREDIINPIGEYLGLNSLFDDILVNPLKQDVAGKIEDLKNEAKEEFEGFLRDNATREITETVENALGLGQSIPVEETGEALMEARKANKTSLEILAEQKRAQLTERKRQECSLVYKKTVESIKRSILYQFSTQITDWIVNGEKPQFVKNPEEFLKATALLAVDRTISSIAPQLCEPFRLSVTLQIPSVSRYNNPFYDRVTCSLNEVVSNIQNFYNNFSSGGWLAYQEVWKPQNNYYSAKMLTDEIIAQNQAAAVESARDDLDRGGGFPSQRKCTEWILWKKLGTKTQLEANKRAGNRVIEDATGMWVGEYYNEEIHGELDEDGVPEPQEDWTKWECTRNEITNPGTITSALAERSAQVDIDYISNSNDIENFLVTIENAIINKLVKSGVKGLKGLLQNIPAINVNRL